jgi:hypothetical protein
MIHYNVWFSFRDGTSESDGLTRVRAFLDDLRQRSQVDGFRLLRSRAKPGQTRLAPFHAVIEFVDQEQFDAAFRDVETTGAHAGRHGLMIENVDIFIVETFEELAQP